MTLVTLDPGVNGAIVCYESYPDEGTVSIETIHMPKTEEEITELLMNCVEGSSSKPIFVVEQIPYTVGINRPGARMGKLFENYGYLKGVLSCMYGEVVMVSPQKWQKMYAPLPKEYNAKKTKLWDIARELYPDDKVYRYAADCFCLLNWYLNKDGE